MSLLAAFFKNLLVPLLKRLARFVEETDPIKQALLDVIGWESFEPILSRIEQIDYAELWRCAGQVPYEWYEHDGEGYFNWWKSCISAAFWLQSYL